MTIRFILCVLILLAGLPLPLSASTDSAYTIFTAGASQEKSLQIFAARKLFTESIRLDPYNTGYQEHTAWFLNDYGFSAEAEPAFLRLAELNPSETVFRGLGWSQLSNGNIAASMATYRKVFPDIPRGITDKEAEAEVRRRLSVENDAKISGLQQRLSLLPSDISTQKELFRNYAYQGLWDKSDRIGRDIRKTAPDDLTFHFEYARMLYWAGRLEQSEREFAAIASHHPDNPFILWQLAKVRSACGKFKEAEDSLESALKLAPGAPDLIRERKYLVVEQLRALNAPGKRPQFTVTTDWYENSDRYSRFDSGISFLVLPLQYATISSGYTFSRFRKSGYESVNRHSVFLQADKEFSKSIHGSAVISGNFYDNQQSHLNARLSSTVAYSQSGIVKLSYDHIDIIDTEPVFSNQLHNLVTSIGAVHQKLTTNDYSAYLRQELAREVALWGKISYGDYSDGNRKFSTVAGIDYTPVNIPGLKLTYIHFYLDYARMAHYDAYFDPKDFSSHNFGVAYRKEFDRLHLGGESFFHYLQRSSGTGTTAAGFAELRLSDNQNLRCEMRYFYQNRGEDRYSRSGHFSAAHYLLSYAFRF